MTRTLADMLQPVPQCDFDRISPADISVYGDGYMYGTARQYHQVHMPDESWEACRDKDVYRDMEAEDRCRAFAERTWLRDAIVDSPHNVTFSASFHPTMVVGCALDLDVYYAYCHASGVMWINGCRSEPVVELLLGSKDCTYPSSVQLTTLVQSVRKAFLNTAFKFEWSRLDKAERPFLEGHA